MIYRCMYLSISEFIRRLAACTWMNGNHLDIVLPEGLHNHTNTASAYNMLRDGIRPGLNDAQGAVQSIALATSRMATPSWTFWCLSLDTDCKIHSVGAAASGLEPYKYSSMAMQSLWMQCTIGYTSCKQSLPCIQNFCLQVMLRDSS